MTITEFFFPLRTRLQNEVDYLRMELARANRRADELIEALTRQPEKTVRPEPRPLPPVKPRGWAEFRQATAAKDKEKEQQDAQQPIQEA